MNALSDISQSFRYYSQEQKDSLDQTRIPQHIAVIMDGNRRWAHKHSFQMIDGHTKGADILIDILKAAQELNVQVMTLYVFSTENWHRSPQEVAALMWLYETYIPKQIPEMVEQKMRFETIGELEKFPSSLQKVITDAKQATLKCDGMQVVFAMNYGARDEIKRACQKILRDAQIGNISSDQLSEKVISTYLDTAPYPDLDLLIRTGGEFRMSNYLLWQLYYAEIHVTPTLWPDFTPIHLYEAILDFQKRKRRHGV